jgi:hypothetical protein
MLGSSTAYQVKAKLAEASHKLSLHIAKTKEGHTNGQTDNTEAIPMSSANAVLGAESQPSYKKFTF